MKKFLFLIVPSNPEPTNLTKEAPPKSNFMVDFDEHYLPLGPLSIISYVNNDNQNIQFEILDLNLLFSKGVNLADVQSELIQKLNDFNPNYIGLYSPFYSCYSNFNWISNSIKASQLYNPIIIVGGILASGLYKEIFNDFPDIDICVIGEGEIPVKAIVSSETPLESWINNTSIVTRESLQANIEPQPQFLETLDLINELDFKTIDIEKYNNDIPSINITTSRGCSFNCYFCSVHMVFGKKIRYFSVERVCRDISNYVSMGFRYLNFFDDNFLYDINRAKTILKYICSLNIKNLEIAFPGGLMASRIDEELAELLARLNLRIAPLAVESGSPYVLKLMNKPVNLDLVKRSVKFLRNHPIRIQTFLVVGLPGETDAHRHETINFINELGVDWVSVNIVTPFPGSAIYDECLKNNYLRDFDIFNWNMKKCFISTLEYEASYIERFAYTMNLSLNYVNNYNMRVGNYEMAKLYFVHITTKFPFQAFAHYYLSKAQQALGEPFEIYNASMQKYREIIAKDTEWANYATEFQLEP